PFGCRGSEKINVALTRVYPGLKRICRESEDNSFNAGKHRTEVEAMINGVSQPNPYKPRVNATSATNVQAGGASQAPSTPMVQSVAQAPAAQNQVAPLGQMLTQMFSALATALKGLISWIANLFQQPA